MEVGLGIYSSKNNTSVQIAAWTMWQMTPVLNLQGFFIWLTPFCGHLLCKKLWKVQCLIVGWCRGSWMHGGDTEAPCWRCMRPAVTAVWAGSWAHCSDISFCLPSAFVYHVSYAFNKEIMRALICLSMVHSVLESALTSRSAELLWTLQEFSALQVWMKGNWE